MKILKIYLQNNSYDSIVIAVLKGVKVLQKARKMNKKGG